MDDIIKLFTLLDEQQLLDSLPRYVAGDFNRLPLIKLEDMDIYVLMKKLNAFEDRLLKVEVQQNHCGSTQTTTSLVQPSTLFESPDVVIHSEQITGDAVVSVGETLITEAAKTVADEKQVVKNDLLYPYSHALLTVVPDSSRQGQQVIMGQVSETSQVNTTGASGNDWSLQCQSSNSQQNSGNDWQIQQSRRTQNRAKRRVRILGTADAQDRTLRAGGELIKKRVFHIDNLYGETTTDTVQSFLSALGVQVLSCFPVKSWLHSKTHVTSMRVCINARDSTKMLDARLWPQSVIVKDWKFIKSSNNG